MDMFRILLRGEELSHKVLAAKYELEEGSGAYAFYDADGVKNASFPIECVKAVLRETELTILTIPGDYLSPMRAAIYREQQAADDGSQEQRILSEILTYIKVPRPRLDAV
jgi:hypothetical protein